MADTTARAAEGDIAGHKPADMMAEVARRAMDQGEEAVRLTLQAIAAAQAPVAERSLADCIRVSDSAAQIAKIYLQSADRTTADLEIHADVIRTDRSGRTRLAKNGD